MAALKVLDAAALPMPTAIRAIRDALSAGLDPAADPPRSVVPVEHGQLLLMPAEWGGFAGVKVATVAPDNPAVGRPRIQGKYLLLDGPTLTPVALVDAMALTALRTAAVSAVAVDALAKPLASSLVVFGTGPQARAHVAAIRAVRTIKQVIVVGRDRGKADAFAAEIGGARVGWSEDVAQADVVACCTTARTPLFDGRLLRPAATVVAVGSHEPDAAEVDATAFGTVVVEARRTALREAGDIVLAKLRPESLVELGTLVRDGVALSGPRLFKSVGMAWEDLVVAATIHQQSQ